MGNHRTDPLAPVVESLSAGWHRMTWLLFRGPEARLENWIWWGLIALLAGSLGGQNGTQSGWRESLPSESSPDPQLVTRVGLDPFDSLDAFDRIAWTLPLVATLVAIGILLALVLLYLRCRFRFVMLDGVLSGAPRIRGVYGRTAGPGLAYFAFELLLFGAAIVLFAPLLLVWWPAIVDAFRGDDPAVPALFLRVLFSVAYGVPLLIALLLVEWFAHDFVVPLAWTREGGFWSAFGAAWRLVFSRLGASLFYLLLRVLLAIVAVFVVLFGCCLSICVWAWPAGIGIGIALLATAFPLLAVILAPVALAAFFLVAWIISTVTVPVPVLFRSWSYAFVRWLDPALPDWAPDAPVAYTGPVPGGAA